MDSRPAPHLPDGVATPGGHAEYMHWNDAFAEHFFRPEFAGQRVILFVSDETLDEIASRAGLDADGFVDAVKAGPPWVTREGLCQRALQALKEWRDRGIRYPPYVGYLALFVLAVGLDAPDYATFSYYPRLNRLLGEPDEQGGVNSFDRMYQLWDDLEAWSVRDRKGELGVFEAAIAGEQLHVGLPKAQTLLTEHERDVLPDVFFAAGLDPTSDPPDAELLRALVQQGAARLRPRTLELARSAGEQDLREALAEVVGEELQQWDGSHAETNGGGALTGGLRLQLSVDAMSGNARASLRGILRDGAVFPLEGLVLSASAIEGELRCVEQVPAWSTALAQEDGQPFDAASLDWCESLAFDTELGQFRFAGREVRIFTLGERLGLPGYVEAGQIPLGTEFLIACRSRRSERVAEWAVNACASYVQIQIASGLPSGWELWRAGALNDVYDQAPFEHLVRNDALRVRLVGGLRAGTGSEYFAFALPEVKVDGPPELTVSCDGADLVCRAPGSYAFGDSVQENTVIVIEASAGDRARRRSLLVGREFAWKIPQQAHLRNGFSAAEQIGSVPGVVGAEVSGSPADLTFAPDCMTALPHGPRSFQNLTLLGRNRGEILRWQADAEPPGWSPVWALEARRRTKVFYVGSGLDEAGPGAPDPGLRHLWAEWSEAFVRNRRRAELPRHPELVRLWNAYLTEAGRRA